MQCSAPRTHACACITTAGRAVTKRGAARAGRAGAARTTAPPPPPARRAAPPCRAPHASARTRATARPRQPPPRRPTSATRWQGRCSLPARRAARETRRAPPQPQRASAVHSNARATTHCSRPARTEQDKYTCGTRKWVGREQRRCARVQMRVHPCLTSRSREKARSSRRRWYTAGAAATIAELALHPLR